MTRNRTQMAWLVDDDDAIVCVQHVNGKMRWDF